MTDALADLHERIRTNLVAISAARPNGRPIYLLEHSLDGPAMSDLMRLVGESVRQQHSGLIWWRGRELPLLVAATEIGYRYQGTGTEFWPRLSQALAAPPFDYYARGKMSEYFAAAAKNLGLATPADTAWNRAFRHIAWPITNAILPVEHHRALARGLVALSNRAVLPTEDHQIADALRAVALATQSPRYLAWLEDTATVAAVVRAFFRVAGHDELSSNVLERFRADLALDPVALDDLRRAHAALRRRATRPDQVASPTEARRARRATLRAGLLLARDNDGRFRPFLVPPEIAPPIRDRARASLRQIGYRLRFWGVERPVHHDRLFSPTPIPLDLSTLPSADAVLLPNLDQFTLEADVLEALRSISVDLSPPLLFAAESAESGTAHQLVGRNVTRGLRYFVVTEPPGGRVSDGVRAEGVIAGLRCFSVDCAIDGACDWLASLGFAISERWSLRWVGAPDLGRPGLRRVFAAETPLVALISHSSPSGVHVTLTGPDNSITEVHILDQEALLSLGAEVEGAYRLAVSGQGFADSMEFEVLAPSADQALISLDLEAGSSLQDLLRSELSWRVEAPLPIEDEILTISLAVAGRVIRRTEYIVRDLPARIGRNEPFWERLLTPDVSEQLLLADRADVVLRFGALQSTSFRLERTRVTFDWARLAGTPQLIEARDEIGSVPMTSQSARSPLEAAPVEGGFPLSGNDVVLLRAGRGTPEVVGGLCIGPHSARLGANPGWAPPPRPARLLRTGDSHGPDAVGALPVAEAFVAWSAASAENLMIEMYRSQIAEELERWQVEQVCGTEWARQEGDLRSRSGGDIWDVFLDICDARGLGFGQIALPPDEATQLRDAVSRIIRARSPEFHDGSGDDTATEASLGATFDDAFNSGYQAVLDMAFADERLASFGPEDFDVGHDPAAWADAFRTARDRCELAPIAAMIAPLEGADVLRAVDYPALGPDDLGDLLDEWNRRFAAAGTRWDKEQIKAGLWLWYRPAIAARQPWRSAVTQMLADRLTTRAIRYVALRARSLARSSKPAT